MLKLTLQIYQLLSQVNLKSVSNLTTHFQQGYIFHAYLHIMQCQLHLQHLRCELERTRTYYLLKLYFYRDIFQPMRIISKSELNEIEVQILNLF